MFCRKKSKRFLLRNFSPACVLHPGYLPVWELPADSPQPQLKAEYIIPRSSLETLRSSAGSLLEQPLQEGWVGNRHQK